jgi:hypothetical protein
MAMLQNDKAKELKSFDDSLATQAVARRNHRLGFRRKISSSLKMPVTQIRANIKTVYKQRIRLAAQPYSNKKSHFCRSIHQICDRYSSVLNRAGKYRLEMLFAIVALEQRAKSTGKT